MLVQTGAEMKKRPKRTSNRELKAKLRLLELICASQSALLRGEGISLAALDTRVAKIIAKKREAAA